MFYSNLGFTLLSVGGAVKKNKTRASLCGSVGSHCMWMIRQFSLKQKKTKKKIRLILPINIHTGMMVVLVIVYVSVSASCGRNKGWNIGVSSLHTTDSHVRTIPSCYCVQSRCMLTGNLVLLSIYRSAIECSISDFTLCGKKLQ